MYDAMTDGHRNLAVPPGLTLSRLARLIDHTVLGEKANEDTVKVACFDAMLYNFASVCIPPEFVPIAVERLDRHPSVKICTVIGFPTGLVTTSAKLKEANAAVANGAQEIDWVVNPQNVQTGWGPVEDDEEARHLASMAREAVEHELMQLALCSRGGEVVTKVILETCALTDDMKIAVCAMAAQFGVTFVKTSTGFGTPRNGVQTSGATVHDVALMRMVTMEHRTGVKASGGIRSLDDALAMLNAGASRIGTSAGKVIMEQAAVRLEG